MYYQSVDDQTRKSAVVTAKESLSAGNIVALPTDTVYGIAAIAQIPEAVEKLYEAKGRRRDNPISICVGDVTELKRRVTIYPILLRIIRVLRLLLRYLSLYQQYSSSNFSNFVVDGATYVSAMLF